MTDIEKLVGDESRLEVGQKINEIIDTKVSKSGDTMTGDLYIAKDYNPILFLKNTSQERGVAASTDAGTQYLYFADKNNAPIGSVAVERYTDGRNCIKLQAFSQDGTTAPAIRIFATADNTGYATLPSTPSASDSSNKIATTAFCDGQWVAKRVVLTDTVTFSNSANTTFSLSDYLPNDGKLYEVKFFCAGNASNNCQYNYSMGFEWQQLIFASSGNWSSNHIGLANSSRTLTIAPTSITSGTNKFSVTLTAYRRVR